MAGLPQAWMPADMLTDEKDHWAGVYPTDFHMAAAVAWESWAGQMAEGEAAAVQSVSTGAQSITYAKGSSRLADALDRANWHRARAKAASVPVGPTYAVSGYQPDDDRDGGTIVTEHLGSLA